MLAARKLNLLARLSAKEPLRLPAGPSAGASLGPWTKPTLQNSWAQFESEALPCRYRIARDGRVTFRGAVSKASGASLTTIFTLPVGYRPTQEMVFLVDLGGSPDFISVKANGEVKYAGGSSAVSFLILDGVSFYTD